MTPCLPVRHHKPRHTIEASLTEDLTRECTNRGLPPPAAAVRTHAGATPDERLGDAWARDFRRYRLREQQTDRRTGLGLRLVFDQPLTGPILLGRLSHFGLGVFLPNRPA
jgi:CRISPR-associated protein Csb2